MSANPEKESRAFQRDLSEAEGAEVQQPQDVRVTGRGSALLSRGVAAFRSAILGLLPFLARVPRRVLAGTAGLLILFATANEWRNIPPPINSPSPRILGWTWWNTPRQLNAERTLPSFDNAVIESIEVVPKGTRVWIAGDAGLLAYSDVDGATWTTFHYDPGTGAMVKDGPVTVASRSTLVIWHVEADQVPLGGIRGTVTDEQGTVISGADVSVTNVKTGQTASSKSNIDGSYRISELITGIYDLRTTHPGFIIRVVKGIPVVATTTQVINVVLKVGPVSEQVTVQAEVPTLQTETTTRTKGGGPQQTLTQTPPKGPPNWVNLDFFAAGTILVSTGGAYVLYTPDAGATWTPYIPSSILYPAVRGPGRWVDLYSGPRGSQATVYSRPNEGFTFGSGAEVWSEGSNHQLMWRDQPAISLMRKAPVKAQIYGIAGAEPNQVWAAGVEAEGSPVIYHSGDKGQNWTLQYPTSESVYPEWHGTKFALSDVVFREDGKTGYAAGTLGAILRTRDAGHHWEPITRGAVAPGKLASAYRWWQQPVRIPAPVSLLFFVFGFLLLVPALMPEAVPRAPTERTIANLAVSDAPVFLAEKDELGFTPVARAIAGLLRNKATGLPLTVAINAPWGRGKTSLMSLVQQELKASGWRTVWFNAWHHQEETSMLASLLQTVRHKAPPELLMRGGVRYRVRLLAKRLWRWRTLWVLAGVTALFLSEKVVHDHNPQIYRNAAQYVYNIVSGGATGGEKSSEGSKAAEKPGVLQVAAKMLLDLTAESGNTGEGHIIPLLVLLVLLFLLVVQILQSFGANPAELLAKTSDRKTVAGLEAQTSFLEKFRDQYGEVVGALGKYRLAIFVDDLDRCRPDKIAETLEAANYLMAAGPCALVLALEEQAVIVGLGLSFQRMAEEIGNLPEDRKSAPGDLLAEAREKRQSFAKNYVEKLFNVVVQTPPVVADSLAQLLAGRPRLQEKLRKMEHQRRRKAQVQDLVRVPAAAAILGMLFLGGYSFLRALLPPTETLTASQQLPQKNAPAASGGNLASPSPKGAGVTAATGAAPAIVPTYAAAKIPIPSAWFETWWQRLVWGLVALSILVPLSLRRPPPLIADSADFTEALVTWAPVLAARNSSPRFAKRVLNRLRYLSMLERQAEEQSRMAAAVSTHAQPERIPEPLLVAFGTQEAVAPGSLASQSAFGAFRIVALTSGSKPGDPVVDLASNTFKDHMRRFGDIPDAKLDEYRQRFVDLSAGIMAR